MNLTETEQLVNYSGITAIELLLNEMLISDFGSTIKNAMVKKPELKIVYNPFSVKTSFSLNGEQGCLSELENRVKGQRIQQWIHCIFTPELFTKIINGNELDFVFEGSDVEIEDVRDAVNVY